MGDCRVSMRGVSFDKHINKYRAYLDHSTGRKYLGSWTCQDLAAEAVDRAVTSAALDRVLLKPSRFTPSEVQALQNVGLDAVIDQLREEAKRLAADALA